MTIYRYHRGAQGGEDEDKGVRGATSKEASQGTMGTSTQS